MYSLDHVDFEDAEEMDKTIITAITIILISLGAIVARVAHYLERFLDLVSIFPRRTVPPFAIAHTFCASRDGPRSSDFVSTI